LNYLKSDNTIGLQTTSRLITQEPREQASNSPSQTVPPSLQLSHI